MRVFFAALNAFSQATVGHTATDGDLFAAYDAVQHYMKFICMPKLAACHMGTVCHASNHGTQVKGCLPLLLDHQLSKPCSSVLLNMGHVIHLYMTLAANHHGLISTTRETAMTRVCVCVSAFAVGSCVLQALPPIKPCAGTLSMSDPVH